MPPDKVEYVPNLPINQDCQTYSAHYAPYYSDAYQQRAIAIADWVARTKPTAMVVDVSAEITQYLRWLGVPVILVLQHGDRDDLPHLCGYDAAYRLFAPYPEILESPGTPSWIRAKTIYSPGFSRYSSRQDTKADARAKLNLDGEQSVVVVINGGGGGEYSLAEIVPTAKAAPEWQWLIMGKVNRDVHHLPENISVLGWQEDTYTYLKAADVAIASGGHNTTMEIGSARVPFLCIPESRPFNEQQVRAELLAKLSLCYLATSFPRPNAIEYTLHNLKSINVNRWQDIMAIDGAVQAAKAIESEVKLLANYQNSLESKLSLVNSSRTV